MTREYKLPDGTPVPADLLDRIHRDGRAFEAAQEPGARTSVAVRKLANELPRLRDQLDHIHTELFNSRTIQERAAVAQEIMALYELGFSPEVIRATSKARDMLIRYGLEI